MTCATDDVESVKRQFALYGFVACPLTDEQIATVLNAGLDAYGVGCDVESGFSFHDAMKAARL